MRTPTKRNRLRNVVLALIAAMAVTGCQIEPEDAPWAELSLEHAVGWATRMKLAGLRGDVAECRIALTTAAELEVRDAAPDAGTQACPLAGAVAIERSGIAYGQELAATCALAASIYIWEREVVQRAAIAHFATQVERIETLGTFACRNVYGRANDRRSEHATANAIDIAGFRLANGEVVRVVRDWDSTGPAGAFLRDVRDGSCELFNGVLGPEYNAAHADHLHLDLGPYRICS